MKKSIDWAEANAACEALTEQQDSLTRDIVTRLAEKWTLWALAELAEADAPLRFSRLMERVEGVSQKSLTKVLRQLERDGLVTRAVFAEVPPRVEYAITDLALEMLELVHPLWQWTTVNIAKFEAAHATYDHEVPARVKRA
ncbi:DNA-binding HxlR family transcriptional regulator [Granulicella aggregans]|uniref:DNA-binding HxlR family transcriptional regulator n=1 Tax=Granulicella aggregans TaxID=474949 RepID=A0A7W8E6P5_9BACT|nr:helix-turn-helix domain-containing protein [Granulicella aggregans]MBB5059465.1 DNA-binding HxlR family transcriptional regulator [Granulicella aggregans]